MPSGSRPLTRPTDGVSSGLVKQREQFACLTVLALNRQVDKDDVDQYLYFPTDGENLINRQSEATILAPDVAGVTTVVSCGYFAEGDDLVGC